MLLSIFLPFFCIGNVLSHSWLSCPLSYDTNPTRGGFFNGPCEGKRNRKSTEVQAGDRLKVGWTSNNHAGGFVRLGLVPESEVSNENFLKNVLKVACYGKDQRPGKSRYGDCVHPCNARPGCQYQSDISDVERYDTTITIPTNLKDGRYVLQFVSLVGNAQKPYYSCASITVNGGNPNMDCSSNDPPTVYNCHRSGGPPMSKITTGMKRGDFCYHNNRRGNIDDRIVEVPINVDCDPRITCANSIKDKVCRAENDMDKIQNARDPKQPNCGLVKPPPAATCSDGKQNQGEEDVDCGGPCPACPTAAPNTGVYHSKINHQLSKWGNGKITIDVIKDIPSTWELTVQYSEPMKIGSVWGDAILVWRNEGNNIYRFQKARHIKLPKAGDKILIQFTKQYVRGDVEPLTMSFDLKEESRKRRDIIEFGCDNVRCPKGKFCAIEYASPCRHYPCPKRVFCKKLPSKTL